MPKPPGRKQRLAASSHPGSATSASMLPDSQHPPVSEEDGSLRSWQHCPQAQAPGVLYRPKAARNVLATICSTHPQTAAARDTMLVLARSAHTPASCPMTNARSTQQAVTRQTAHTALAGRSAPPRPVAPPGRTQLRSMPGQAAPSRQPQRTQHVTISPFGCLCGGSATPTARRSEPSAVTRPASPHSSRAHIK